MANAMLLGVLSFLGIVPELRGVGLPAVKGIGFTRRGLYSRILTPNTQQGDLGRVVKGSWIYGGS
jgi:hypothetical protein